MVIGWRRLRTGRGGALWGERWQGVYTGEVARGLHGLQPAEWVRVSDLFATLPENVNNSLYADDGALWTTSASLPEAVSRLQIALDRIAEWSHTWGLSVSPTKINAIIFTLCRPPSPPPLFLSNSTLSYVSHVRFLGLIFDRHLTWHKKHLHRFSWPIRCRLFNPPPSLWSHHPPQTQLRLFPLCIRLQQ